ncbi:hypothetical protein [Nocardioides sp.]|uniref:hypothetical protein n=1 Tax=Nocardioides sp. TaxID=35761 RepID=UPI002C061814|nr:hypothetical protein [Nocardioides sp.]HXH77904.1 hypothetical protein [Nocardioides sp.]
MSTLRVVTSRRAVISLAVAAPAVLGACELDPPSTAPPQTPSPEPVPDAEVVGLARKAISVTVASVEAAAAAHPRLGPELDLWLSLHAAHLEVLDDGTEDQVVEGTTPTGKQAVDRRRILDEETVLAARLADGARQAASGDLARALASMSAAMRQRLVT